jgi:hypothetical protein
MVLSRPQRQLEPFSDWSEPINLGPVVNSGFNEFHPGISRDGLSLYFTSDRPGGVNGGGLPEIWVTQREDLDANWEHPLNLGSNINVPGYESSVPNLTPDGRWLFFNSNRPGGYGQDDLWVARREDPEDADHFTLGLRSIRWQIDTSSDEAPRLASWSRWSRRAAQRRAHTREVKLAMLRIAEGKRIIHQHHRRDRAQPGDRCTCLVEQAIWA